MISNYGQSMVKAKKLQHLVVGFSRKEMWQLFVLSENIFLRLYRIYNVAFSELFMLKIEINAQERFLKNTTKNKTKQKKPHSIIDKTTRFYVPKIKLFRLVKFKLSCYVDTSFAL